MVTLFHWFVAIYLVLSDVHTFYSLPAIQDNEINFLRSYGYLPKIKPSVDGLTANDILHEDTLTNAIKHLQQYGAIEQTGVIDEATKELLKTPRCGVPDVETSEVSGQNERRTKRFSITGAKWNLPRKGRDYVTWAFINKNHPMDVAKSGSVRRLIHEVVQVWEHNTNLTFRESHPQDADIEIDFARMDHGDGFSFTGRGDALAHAFQPGENLGGDIHMDFDEDWDIEDNNGGTINFFMTLLHEFGHSLGLLHSDLKESIMFAWYQPNLAWDRKCKALFDDDVNGVAAIYGRKKEFKFGVTCVNGQFPHPPTKVPTRTTPRSEITSYRNTQRPRPRPTSNPGIITVKPDVRPYNPDHDRDRYEPPSPAERPDKCDTNFDAILYYRTELMIFKGQWFWRLRALPSGKYEMLENQPGRIGAMWEGLKGYDHIDAVFEMKNGNLAFFKDRKILVIDNSRKLIGASDLKHFGFDHRLKKVDAILKWGHNNNTYVFSGDYFWKVDDNLHVVADVDKYPRRIGHPFWQGVTKIDVDTAITDHNGITYFLSGLFSYKFDNGYSKLDLDNPLISSQLWMMGCDFSQADIDKIKNERQTSKAPATMATTISPSMKPKKDKKRYGGIVFVEAIDPNKINITAIAGNLSNIN